MFFQQRIVNNESSQVLALEEKYQSFQLFQRWLDPNILLPPPNSIFIETFGGLFPHVGKGSTNWNNVDVILKLWNKTSSQIILVCRLEVS